MKGKILIVDDVEINRKMLAEMLKGEYEILMASNGREAYERICRDEEIAVMLLDLLMPEMDGFQLLEALRSNGMNEKVGIIIISSEKGNFIEKRCFELGVADFIHRPFDSHLVRRRVANIYNLYQHKTELEHKVEQQTETLRRQYKLLLMQSEQLNKSKENVIDILGTVVEYRNLESGEHIKRVKGYTRILATRIMEDYPEYRLNEKKVDIIVSASALHDIGKIAIPDTILLKPSKLTPEEYEYMKSHTTKGGEIIRNIKNVWDKEYGDVSYDICRGHHERYDGKGYPDGLKGDEIPISAQIVAIADVYDALVNERVYKSAYTTDKAFQMIIAGECGIFSPKILDCFWNSRKDFEKLAKTSFVTE